MGELLMDARWRIEHGEALTLLRAEPADSHDALVTDPPAGIGFMGRDWDKNKGDRMNWIAWLTEIASEGLRCLKPGAYGLVWALPRTSHWTGLALENAGFEIRDCIHHAFGTGFPKSLNVGGGRGTALKPAHEHWWLIRKPLVGTVAENIAAHGTGALNVDACRISGIKQVPGSMPKSASASGLFGGMDARPAGDGQDPNVGRWPPNLLLSHSADCKRIGGETEAVPVWECDDDCAVRLMDSQDESDSDVARFFPQFTIEEWDTQPPELTKPIAHSTSAVVDGIDNGANLGRAECENNLRTDGSGSKRAAEKSLLATRSITKTKIRPTTHQKTSSAFPKASIGLTTTENAPRTETDLPERSSDNAEDVNGGSRSRNSVSGRRARITDTANRACSVTRENGESETPITSEKNASFPISQSISPGDSRPTSTFVDHTSHVLDLVPPFYYSAKPSRGERDLGLELFRARSGGEATKREDESAGTQSPRSGSGRNGGVRNIHPTVKSVELMRWLCRLVTPPGGLVADWFAGSGTTGCAALLEGLRFFGCEMNDTDEEPFVSIARARLAHIAGGNFTPRESLRDAVAPRQGALFG